VKRRKKSLYNVIAASFTLVYLYPTTYPVPINAKLQAGYVGIDYWFPLVVNPILIYSALENMEQTGQSAYWQMPRLSLSVYTQNVVLIDCYWLTGWAGGIDPAAALPVPRAAMKDGSHNKATMILTIIRSKMTEEKQTLNDHDVRPTPCILIYKYLAEQHCSASCLILRPLRKRERPNTIFFRTLKLLKKNGNTSN
jgi:hypothetical protein